MWQSNPKYTNFSHLKNPYPPVDRAVCCYGYGKIIKSSNDIIKQVMIDLKNNVFTDEEIQKQYGNDVPKNLGKENFLIDKY